MNRLITGMQRNSRPAEHAAETIEQKDHAVIAECLAFVSGRLPTGMTVQVDQTGVSVSLGNERFTLHPSRFELQADIEALCRMAARRVR